MFVAFKPQYTSAGFFTEYLRGKLTKVEYFNVSWKTLGPADSMEDARKRYGGRPVLADLMEAV